MMIDLSRKRDLELAKAILVIGKALYTIAPEGDHKKFNEFHKLMEDALEHLKTAIGTLEEENDTK